MQRRIILASTSQKRKEIFETTGLEFEIVHSNYEEDMTLPMSPEKLAKFLSKGKAESVVKNYSDTIILAFDTFVILGNEILGKPHTEEKAKEMLKKLSDNTHFALTGFTVIDTKNKKEISKTVKTKLIFKKLNDEMIDDYIKSDEKILKYAGSYTLNDIVEKSFVEKIEGDPLNVMGLPLSEVILVLKEFGVDISEKTLEK
ncbi:MAG: nucleoside triphosphate pyrophosphatase [Candidatus Paceibacterota bacterium]|jgi:septum formation protein